MKPQMLGLLYGLIYLQNKMDNLKKEAFFFFFLIVVFCALPENTIQTYQPQEFEGY